MRSCSTQRTELRRCKPLQRNDRPNFKGDEQHAGLGIFKESGVVNRIWGASYFLRKHQQGSADFYRAVANGSHRW